MNIVTFAAGLRGGKEEEDTLSSSWAVPEGFRGTRGLQATIPRITSRAADRD